MKRSFAAIDIPDYARRQISIYMDRLRRSHGGIRVGWERPEKLHFTLNFFGDVEDAIIPLLIEIIEDASRGAQSFEAVITGTGCFPPRGDPRILWLGVDDHGKMRRLVQTLAATAQPLGFAAEKRDFVPHLTIARLREPSRSLALASAHLRAAFDPIRMQVIGLSLYESTLGPGESVYRKLFESRFRDP